MGRWGQGRVPKRKTARSHPRSAPRGESREPAAEAGSGAAGLGSGVRELSATGGVRGAARPSRWPGWSRHPRPLRGRDGTGRGSGGALTWRGEGGAYLEVGSPLGYPAHHDVRRGHGPGGREAEAHVAGCAHLEAEGEPVVPRAPAQPVLALRVEERAVREGPARAPRGRAGEQRPQQE